MTPTELLELLREFYRDKLSLVLRHQAGARCIGQYDFNNAYQYIIAREDTHLEWIADAIVDAGGSLPEPGGILSLPESGNGKELMQTVLRDDVQRQRSFVERWHDRMRAVTHARQQKMLEFVLGEMLEHLRLFEQAADGRTDLLGSHAQGTSARGEVMPNRWIG